jgi:hypothetical protein
MKVRVLREAIKSRISVVVQPILHGTGNSALYRSSYWSPSMRLENLSKKVYYYNKRANNGGQGEIGTPALWDVTIFQKLIPNDSPGPIT